MDFNIDLTEIILSLLGILGTVITMYIIPILKKKAEDENWHRLFEIVAVAVNGAEQLGYVDKAVDKLEYATNQVKKALAKHNLVFDDDIIRTTIESFVLDFKKGDK